MSSFYFKEGAQQIGDFRAGNGAIFKEEMLHTLRVLGDIPDSGKVKMFQKKKGVGPKKKTTPNQIGFIMAVIRMGHHVSHHMSEMHSK